MWSSWLEWTLASRRVQVDLWNSTRTLFPSEDCCSHSLQLTFGLPPRNEKIFTRIGRWHFFRIEPSNVEEKCLGTPRWWSLDWCFVFIGWYSSSAPNVIFRPLHGSPNRSHKVLIAFHSISPSFFFQTLIATNFSSALLFQQHHSSRNSEAWKFDDESSRIFEDSNVLSKWLQPSVTLHELKKKKTLCRPTRSFHFARLRLNPLSG